MIVHLHRVVLAAAFVASGVIAATWSCSPFEANDAAAADASSADAGGDDADVATVTDAADAASAAVTERDFTVQLDWPTVALLDPRTDHRVGKMRVTVTDALDASRTRVIDPPFVQDGPFTIAKLRTTHLVDVVVEMRGFDERLLGYGERRAWDLDANAVVPVAVRKRLLYVSVTDRGPAGANGELHVLDMAPITLAEPGMDEMQGISLDSLRAPTSIAVTRDGLHVVQGGAAPPVTDGGPSAGALTVIETGSHATKTYPLPFWPARIAVLDDDHTVLAVPSTDYGAPSATTFARVDLDGGAVAQVATGATGGSLRSSAIATSPDRKHVAVVGSLRTSVSQTPFLFVYDVVKQTVLQVNLALEDARGVGFTTDGKSIVVAGHVKAADWGTGMLLFFDASQPGKPSRTIPLATGTTEPTGLFIHPDGVHAWVTNDTKYPSPTCCDEMRLIDLVQGVEVLNTPQHAFEIASTVLLPYAPKRFIAGLTDFGNDVNGSIVDITDGGALPTTITSLPPGSLGSADLATPFGKSQPASSR